MNVKQKFLDWFIDKNTYKSLPKTTVQKYIDGYVDYLDFDPFEFNDDLTDIEEVKEKIISRTLDLKKNQNYIDFQYKSSRNAPEAILGKNNYFVFLDELKNNNTKGKLDLSAILNQPDIQSIINEPQFYFQKGQDALNKWMNLPISDELKNTLISLSKNYIKIQEEAEKREDLKIVLDLLFEVITYCDIHAKDKLIFNQYEDKRALADAFVRMNNWTEKLIQYRLMPEEVGAGSTKNAFDYLLDPINNSTVLSENHRKQISENLIGKPYNYTEFVADLETFFSEYQLKTLNPQNYSHLLMKIVYSFQNKWRKENTGTPASQFSEIIELVKNVIENDSGSSNLFVFEKPFKNYVWIKDINNIIGNTRAHYEIIRRKERYYIEIHFEGTKKDQDYFKQNIDSLPDGLGWFTWSKSNSIRYTQDFNSDDPELISNLVEGLIYMEKTIGEKLRQIITAMNGNKPPKKEAPLNQILFGPPGTGKTFDTVNKALEIIGEKTTGLTRKQIKDLFNTRLNEGQIVFTTFHQSMSYEDFIEGIKPLKPDDCDGFVKYDVVPGVFKRLCRKAETPPNISFDNSYKKLLKDLEENDEIEIKGPKVSYKIKASENGEDLGVISNSYIKNITKEGLDYVSKSNRYAGTWGQYYKALFQLLKDKYGYTESPNSELKNHVLIIDEINRGNISQIFGELITLIEEDKRLGKQEALKVTLPYSKERFGVPPNLYIIGTMNTADRSVEALDTALRRRFCFEEVPPRYNLEELNYDYAGVKGFEILETLNKRIEKLLDKDHQIGHSYLMMGSGDNVEEKLLISFYKNIIPLLQEYFFGDFGKIGLVLGKGFVKIKEWDKKSDSFADFDYQSATEFDDKEVFRIIDYRNSDSNYSVEIKNNIVQMDFHKAIKLLMKHDIE